VSRPSKGSGLRGKDKQQDRQRDNRRGANDPVSGQGKLPEGLLRERKGPISRTRGRTRNPG
jgi:hypothetical protein